MAAESQNAAVSIERARTKMTTEISTAEVNERAAFRATLMAEVAAMRVMMKECEADKNTLRERLNTAEGQILILKASNEIMERWVSFFKDRNWPLGPRGWQDATAHEGGSRFASAVLGSPAL